MSQLNNNKMKKYRSKLENDGTWRAQYRFFLFCIIPTTIWIYFGYEFSNDMLFGQEPTIYKFSTKEDCDNHLKDNNFI